ncbi:MAG TPA: dienelactone hydrolase family protein [Blastocatellia bacterium]|nr:dienelactone hydrolase family protein [Blastocatellia bacterium]
MQIIVTLAAQQTDSHKEPMNTRARTTSRSPGAQEATSPPCVGGAVILSASDRRTAQKRGYSDGAGLDLLSTALASSGIAALRVDLNPHPARGKSTARNGAAEKSIRSAIERLASECGEYGSRITVLAEGGAADAAVMAAQAEWRVRSFVLLSGRLSHQAKETLVEWEDNPALCLVSSEDKPSLRDMRDVYLASRHADADIKVFEEVGAGLGMIAAWAKQFPDREPLERFIAAWVRRSLSSVGRAREVSFRTEDGWKIFGNLLLPDDGSEKAPGVVLLHSGRSDRYIFAGLERLLVRAGFAVLNIDWRGRGMSTNKGSYFQIPKEERAKGGLDAKAAVNFLASQDRLDRERIGLVGVIHGAEYAVRGSIDDPRVKAIALLTGYVPATERERAYLTSGKVHVLYVTCKGHRQVTGVMRSLYEATPGKLARLILYDGGAIGYQLFDLDDKLEPTIVEWLMEGLGK